MSADSAPVFPTTHPPLLFIYFYSKSSLKLSGVFSNAYLT